MLEEINSIMRPYYEKLEEINNKQSDKISEKRRLELSLERLRENKNIEIENYINETLSYQPSLYVGYESRIRRDLELAYEEKENQILDDINKLENETDYSRVDLRELVEIKESIRKQLISTQKELELDLMQEKINFDTIMLQLSRFKYQYDENHQVINGNEWRALWEKSNESSNRMDSIRKSLKEIEENLKLAKLTEEEGKTIMMSMTPWEKEEYERRKNKGIPEELNEVKIEELPTDLHEPIQILDEEPIEDIVDEITEQPIEDIVDEIIEEPIEDIVDEITEQPIEDIVDEIIEEPIEDIVDETVIGDLEDGLEDADQSIPEDLVDSYVPISADYSFNGEKFITDSYNELAAMIYNEVVEVANNMRSIKLDKSSKTNNKYYFSKKATKDSDYKLEGEIEAENISAILPSGEYINVKDINDALKKYYKKNKGAKLYVKEADKDIILSKKDVRNLKKALKKCSTLKLLEDKKVTEFDIKSIFVKSKFSSKKDLVELNNIETEMSSGEYISRDELLFELRKILNDKKQKKGWFTRISEKLNLHRDKNIENDLDDVFIEKPQLEELTTTNEQPKYVNNYDSQGGFYEDEYVDLERLISESLDETQDENIQVKTR